MTRRADTPAVEDQGANPAPPVKPPTWEWYVPIYFWMGGIAAGSWLAITAEDWAGARDRQVIRAGRYLALANVLGGTVLLIADLGRPERFHYMLRIVRLRSAMSLGSWGLTLFGPFLGAAGVLQAAEDGWLGRGVQRRARSGRSAGRLLHVAGLPVALFVGGYTGVLLASTSTPSWARRTQLLGPLFLASGTSSGLAAICAVLEVTGGGSRRTLRRLRRAEAVTLAAELGLALSSEVAARRMPSRQRHARGRGALEAVTLVGGMALPLAMTLRSLTRRGRGSVAGTALALAGSLALRYLTTREGYWSAREHQDTWRLTRAGRMAGAALPAAAPVPRISSPT
jgi:formate-dependent nitrite reductase membrane component NrfD